MYRAPPSPYGGAADSHYSAPQSPGGGPQITPGSITYTTSVDAQGQILYHPFKAVPASYQTPTGIVSGIQWVPAEATQILPSGAQPASVDFAEAWNRGNLSKEDQKNLRDWQRGEEKRRRKEEKDSMKFLREKDRYNQGGGRYENDPELRMARERDAASAASLQRRKSFSHDSSGIPGAYPTAGYAGSGSDGRNNAAFPGTTAPGVYPPPSPRMGYARERKYSTGGGGPGLAEQFAELGLDRDVGGGGPLARPQKYSTHGAHESAERDRARRLSGNFGIERPPSRAYDQGPGGYAPPGPYSKAYSSGAGAPYGNASSDSSYAARPSSPYSNPTYPPAPPQNMYNSQGGSAPYGNRAPSPYRAPSPFSGQTGSASPYARSASPFGAGGPGSNIYPPGHIMEGRPIVGGARSRATTPIPGMAPGMAGSQGMMPSMLPSLAAPECFSRPINAAHPYTPFEPMKIQDMDFFLESSPRMPIVLQTHDVYAEDWGRLMDDTALAWSGRLPLPGNTPQGGKPPKRATLTAKLIELWNHSFFERRGVELVLYKGRERRSGAQYGLVDLPYDDYNDDSSSSSSSSEDDDPNHQLSGFYGGVPSDMSDGRQRRYAAKSERSRRKKEKRLRRREREKRYSLWLFRLPQGGPGGIGAGGGSVYGAQSGVMGTPGYSTSSGSNFATHSPAMSGVGAFRGPSPGPGYTSSAGAGAYGGPSPGSGYNSTSGTGAYRGPSPGPGYTSSSGSGAYRGPSPNLGYNNATMSTYPGMPQH